MLAKNRIDIGVSQFFEGVSGLLLLLLGGGDKIGSSVLLEALGAVALAELGVVLELDPDNVLALADGGGWLALRHVNQAGSLLGGVGS